MNSNDDWVVIGRFGRSHGIKGFISVVSFTEPRDNITNYVNWHAYINQEWQPLKLLHTEINHKFILVQVDGFAEREDVANLTNVNIAIQRTQLPALEAGEYYWEQLIGMEVINLQNILLGNVTEIMPTGSNDVLVVVGEKRHLIPYLLERNIIKIDESQRMITVDWDRDF